MKKPITIHIVTNLGQNKIGIEIKSAISNDTNQRFAQKSILDGLRVNRSGFFSTVTNYLQYPLHVWVSWVFALHKPHK
tara:strand:- start:15332 stop:15565 length:234 start_codon:yes stop_codon:yes gene_type:complete